MSDKAKACRRSTRRRRCWPSPYRGRGRLIPSSFAPTDSAAQARRLLLK